jgi:hypothetical protein
LQALNRSSNSERKAAETRTRYRKPHSKAEEGREVIRTKDLARIILEDSGEDLMFEDEYFPAISCRIDLRDLSGKLLLKFEGYPLRYDVYKNTDYNYISTKALEVLKTHHFEPLLYRQGSPDTFYNFYPQFTLNPAHIWLLKMAVSFDPLATPITFTFRLHQARRIKVTFQLSSYMDLHSRVRHLLP